MTENTWPRTEGLDPLDTDFSTSQGTAGSSAQHVAVPAGTSSGTQSTSSDTQSTKETAKAEASDIAHHASDAAANVTGTAKEEAANVAAEVKTNARDLMAQAKSDLSEQAGTQQQKVAQGFRSVSDELHAMVSSAEEPGMATDLVRQAAERASSVASWLEGRDPSGLLADVKSYARHKPGTFLLLAAGAGILAGRFSRSLKAGAPHASQKSSEAGTASTATIPPVPVAPPVVDAPILGVPDAYPPSTGGTTAGAAAGFGLPGELDTEPVATGPLHTNDPLGDDPLAGGRQ